MKIELLLNRVSFEHAVKTGDVSFNGWIHGPGSNDPDIKSTAIPVLELRKESWGGLMVYGRTGQIFALDEHAFALISRLKTGELLDDIYKNPDPHNPADITSFRAQLEQNGIEL